MNMQKNVRDRNVINEFLILRRLVYDNKESVYNCFY